MRIVIRLRRTRFSPRHHLVERQSPDLEVSSPTRAKEKLEGIGVCLVCIGWSTSAAAFFVITLGGCAPNYGVSPEMKAAINAHIASMTPEEREAEQVFCN